MLAQKDLVACQDKKGVLIVRVIGTLRVDYHGKNDFLIVREKGTYCL